MASVEIIIQNCRLQTLPGSHDIPRPYTAQHLAEDESQGDSSKHPRIAGIRQVVSDQPAVTLWYLGHILSSVLIPCQYHPTSQRRADVRTHLNHQIVLAR